ncbi:hypothetical protein [Desulfosarcina alkanivorans]|nr:hypothetical protein [Desulfosarcina alkanivorans]
MKNRVFNLYLRNFILTFLPLILLFALISAFFWFQEKKSQALLLATAGRQHVETLRRIANDELRTIVKGSNAELFC